MFRLEKIEDDIVLHNKYGKYSRSELETRLREDHLTIKKLGETYNLNPSQIIHVLRLLDISYRNPLGDTRIIGFEITPSVHQVLLGTLLGDAYMKVPRAYELGHSINQMDYLYHVAEQLGSAVPSISYKETHFGKSISFWTNRHDMFVPYSERFYSHGKKRKFFTESTAWDIEAEGLAYWYMDDGKFHEYGAYLCVGNITVEEGTILRDMLNNRFNVFTTFQVHDIQKGYHNIYVKAESRSHFFSLIEPFVIPSMRYKLTGSSYPIETKEKIEGRHMEYCNRINRRVKLSGLAVRS